MFWALEWYIHMIHCLSFECCIALWMYTGRDLFWMHGEFPCPLRDWYSMLLRHTFVYTKLQQSSMCISYPLKSNEHNVIFNDLWLHDRFCMHQLKGWEKRRWLGVTLQVIEHATYLLVSQSQLLCIVARRSPFSTPFQVLLLDWQMKAFMS